MDIMMWVKTSVGMISSGVHPHDNTGMLKAPIRIKQHCPNATNGWSDSLCGHGIQPTWLTSLNIVVEKQQ